MSRRSHVLKRELQEWSRDPTLAFDFDCIKRLIAEIRALKAERDLIERIVRLTAEGEDAQ